MSNGYTGDGQKNASELEREVNRQRDDIEQTLTALIDRLDPGQWMEQILARTRGSEGGDLGRRVVETVRASPIPSIITAAGLSWLLLGQTRSGFGGPQPSGNNVPARESYGVDPDYDPHSGEGHVALEKSGTEAIREHGHRGLDSARGSDSLSRLLHEQPLAVGVIGLALGALVGASLPGTRREDEALGESKRRMSAKAGEAAERVSTKVEDVGRHVAEGVKSKGPKTRH